MDKKQNVILIVLDTQRADHLSCYEYPLKTTPKLDEFALRSTVFKRAIAPAQWTIPTHASIFTGLNPSQHTMLQMNSMLPKQITTVAERLQIEGFKTIGISNNPLIGTMGNGLERGFSYMKNYNFWGSGLLNFQLNRRRSTLNRSAVIKENLKFIAAELLGYSDQTFLRRLATIAPFVWEAFLSLQGRSKFDVTQRSLQDASYLLIEEHAPEDPPMFMFINLMGTHVPYAPPRWAVNRFAKNKMINQQQFYAWRRRVNQAQVDVNNWIDCTSLNQNDIEMLNIFYDAEVFAQDLLVGEFLSRLQSAGKLNDTFVVIVSDHGDHLGEKQRLNHAFGVYEELVHVPLIIWDPQGVLQQGGVYDSLVSTRQLFHTILDAAGVATLDEMASSLRRIGIPGNRSNGDRFNIFAQGYPLDWALNRLKKKPGYDLQVKYQLPSFAAYADSFKLMNIGDKNCLFQLEEDPTEVNDVALQFPHIVMKLSQMLQQFNSENMPVAKGGEHDYQESIVIEHLRALGYLE